MHIRFSLTLPPIFSYEKRSFERSNPCLLYTSNAIINKKNEITEGSEAEINQLVGEAYFMRGYMHFLLVNLYGQPYTKEGAPTSKAIPLKLSLDLEEMPTRNTVEELSLIHI